MKNLKNRTMKVSKSESLKNRASKVRSYWCSKCREITAHQLNGECQKCAQENVLMHSVNGK